MPLVDRPSGGRGIIPIKYRSVSKMVYTVIYDIEVKKKKESQLAYLDTITKQFENESDFNKYINTCKDITSKPNNLIRVVNIDFTNCVYKMQLVGMSGWDVKYL